jgi:RHS repeat-associated protein
MPLSLRAIAALFLASFLPSSAFAQLFPQTKGTPRFGTFGGGPDIIILANLNSHLTIPVFHRPGRGLNFESTLTYDSSVWLSPSSSGSSSWQPVTNWGWGTGGTDIGTISYTTSMSNCIVSGRVVGTRKFWSNWVYYDGSGTPHSFYGSVEGDTIGCPSGGGTDSLSELAQDGSGYTLNLTGDCCTQKLDKIQVVSPDGALITPGSNIQDTNGNMISLSNGQLMDTLGSVPVTISGTSPGPVTYTYTTPSGSSATVTVTYRTYSVQTNFGCSGIPEYGPTSNSLVDRITLPNGTFYQLSYERTPGSSTNVTGRLASTTLPTGGIISYQYTGGNHGIECTDGTTAGLTRTTPDGTWTYSRTLGSGQQSTTTITDPLGNQTVMQFLGIYQTVEQDYQGSSSAGTLLETVSTCYDGLTSNCTTTNFGTPISQLAQTIQLGSTGPIRKHVNFYDGGPGTLNTGVMTEQDDYDYGTGGPGLLIKKMLLNSNACSNANEIVSVVVQNGSGAQLSKVTYNYDETTPVATSGLPQHAAVFAPRCNLTSQSQWLNTTGGQITSHMTHFDTGMLNTATDPNGHATTYSYSSTFAGAYPTTVTNALNQSTTANFDPNTGLVISSTDLNGKASNFSYDNMLRTTQVTYPDGGQTTTCFTDNGGSICSQSPAPFRVVSNTKVTSIMSKTSTSVLDTLGRVTQTQLNSDPQGTVYVDTTYDSLGRVYSASNPYRTMTESTYGVITSFYDALGRTCLVVPPDGTLPAGNTCPATQPTNDILTTYSANTTTVIDQAGKSRKSVTDGLGRLTQVFEDPAGLNYETDYAYDALNNLLTVNQKGGDPNSANWRTRTFTYNSLSQLTQAVNPESGTVNYTYNPDGTFATKVSPAPNQTGTATVMTTYSYDALHRLTQKSFSDGATSSVKYGYDAVALTGCSTTPPSLTITNGIGRRTAMCDAGGAEAWSYDPMGRTLTDARITNTVTKTSSYTYNPDGSPATLTYPSGHVITYTPQSSGTNTVGRTLSAADTPNSINYATAASYAPSGALSTLTNGAGVVSTLYYNSRLQPCRISVKSSGTSPASCADTTNLGDVLDLSYGFNLGSADNGNVMSITNNRSGASARSQLISYDNLNRILTAKTTSTSGANCWDEQFGYDPWGNLLSIGRISGYTCSNEELLSVTATSRNQISGDTYDSAGNLMTIPSVASYLYDAENHLKTAGGVTYTYDGNGKRVLKSNGKLYWYGISGDALDETDSAGNTNNSSFFEYVFFNGKRIARRDYQNNVNYYFADHLGTNRTSTNSAGSICYDADLYPFGGERIVTDTCDSAYKFTGKERDSESGLDNFGARHDSSSLGRFMQPDPSPMGVATADPQSWNLYSYVRNRPTRFVDAGGNWATDVHAQIVTFSLQEYVSAGELQHFIDRQYVMDADQSPDHQYMHAMRAPDQSPEDASNATWKFVADSISGASATLSSNGGFTSISLAWLGDAIHTVEDYTSPMHTSNGMPLPWNGGFWPLKKWGPGLTHINGEDVPDIDWRAIGFAVRLSMASYLQVGAHCETGKGCLTNENFESEFQRNVQNYVQWYYSTVPIYQRKSWLSEDAARQCALGNPAACGE